MHVVRRAGRAARWRRRVDDAAHHPVGVDGRVLARECGLQRIRQAGRGAHLSAHPPASSSASSSTTCWAWQATTAARIRARSPDAASTVAARREVATARSRLPQHRQRLGARPGDPRRRGPGRAVGREDGQVLGVMCGQRLQHPAQVGVADARSRGRRRAARRTPVRSALPAPCRRSSAAGSRCAASAQPDSPAAAAAATPAAASSWRRVGVRWSGTAVTLPRRVSQVATQPRHGGTTRQATTTQRGGPDVPRIDRPPHRVARPDRAVVGSGPRRPRAEHRRSPAGAARDRRPGRRRQPRRHRRGHACGVEGARRQRRARASSRTPSRSPRAVSTGR